MVEGLPRWDVVCTGPELHGVGLAGVEKGACEGCTIVYVYHINYYKLDTCVFHFEFEISR